MTLMDTLAAGKPVPPDYMESVMVGLALVVVLAMILERALAVLFEWGPIETLLAKRKLRAPIALAAAWGICQSVQFDVLAILFARPVGWGGVLVTAAVVAGGSKGAILLFQGVLGFGKGNVDAVLLGARRSDAAPQSAIQRSAEPAPSPPPAKAGADAPWWDRPPGGGNRPQ
ncbi:MAG: hypothetical protein JNK11_13675 [Alphaproteobacteria bacterium]|nr:hypothetical protein [Alphaproteobacteria bacterium]